ncbi:MAG: hypothetical protein ABIR70_18240 [Bryobacteraceae bacterium]
MESKASEIQQTRVVSLSSIQVDALVATLVSIAIFLLASTIPDIPSGYDAYRHVRMASRLVTEGFAEVMKDPWHVAYIWTKPVDPYVGFHVLLAPFTMVFELITAIKLFGAIIIGTTAFVSLRILQHFEVEYRAAWLMIAVFGSGITLHRATVSRPFVLGTLMVLTVTLLTLKNRPGWVAIASAVHAACYSMFFLVAMGPGLWLLLRRDRAAFRLVLCCAFGIGVGLISNPYFPENLSYALVNASATEIATRAGVVVGGELWPMPAGWFLAASLAVALPWFAAIWLRVKTWTSVPFGEQRDILLAVSLLALAGSFRVGRTFEFFVPFATMYAAVQWTPWVKAHRRQALNLFYVAASLCVLNVLLSMESNRNSGQVARYRAVAAYLHEHDPKELVINARWGDYYYLYFWNPTNQYFIGIEPTFTYLLAPEKYWTWRHLSDDKSIICSAQDCSGKTLVDPVSAVRDGLEAKYLLTQHILNPRLEASLDANPQAKAVFRDSFLTLYKFDR